MNAPRQVYYDVLMESDKEILVTDDPIRYRDVHWRLVWEDTCYRDGIIPDESEYFLDDTPGKRITCQSGEQRPHSGQWSTLAGGHQQFIDIQAGTIMPEFTRLEINELGLYVRDTYEFMNDGDDQPLGYWGYKGVIKPSVISELKKDTFIDRGNDRYFRVTNSSFVDYRKKYMGDGRTGDFFVYSTVKLIPVNIIIHLNDLDMAEYSDWQGTSING